MKFPVPHDIKAKTIPGTEGWERMYPYQYQFVTDDPVRNQYEKDTFWFYDGLHYPEPLYPFDTIWDEAWYLALSQFNNRIFMVPPVRGVDHRIINGYVYISPVPVKDPDEIGRRVPNFMERAGYYYKNWDALEAKWKVKMEATIRELEAVKIPRLQDMEDMSVVTDAMGESHGYHLLKNYDDLINLGIKCWQYHFEFLNLGYAAYVFFLDFVQKLFPSIPAQRVTLVDHGVLKNFLMSRSPLPAFPHSNGHGRRQLGYQPIARMGNTIVRSSKGVPFAELRKMLINLVRQQGKPYGLLIDDISGGFTITGRAQPQAFQVEPLIVYKVFPDGRPDELVRGVNIVGTPLTSLTKIVATGDKDSVFDGYCVDESGAVPVSADAPAMLFSEIEVAKKETSTDKPPILPPPAHDPKEPEPRGVKPTPWGQLR